MYYDEALIKVGKALEDFIVLVVGIIIFICSIPFIFWLLHEQYKIEKKLREKGQWPY